jgi:hypothetical protein
VSPVRYKLGFCIPEDDILHSHCRENPKSYRIMSVEKSVDLMGNVASDFLSLPQPAAPLHAHLLIQACKTNNRTYTLLKIIIIKKCN